MHSDRLTNTLKRLAILAVFLLVIGFISPISDIQYSRAAPAVPQAALAPNYAWHTYYGSNADEYSYGITTDAQGNLYLVGGSTAAWQGPGNVPPRHAYSGSTDILVMKFSANGDYQWHTFYGSSSIEYGVNIVVDEAGNIYVVGYGRANWQGDNATDPWHPYSSGADITVLKLDNNGDYQWHTFYGAGGTANNDDEGYGIALGEQGDIFITGRSPAAWLGDEDRAPLHPYTGGDDLVVLKMSSAGIFSWHTFYGSDSSDIGSNIATDGQGDLVILGYSYGSWFGDENTSPLHAYSDGYDIAVLKLDEHGEYLWHTFYGSSAYDDVSEGLALDPQSNIIISGYSDASWSGDGGIAPLHPHSGDFDITLLKLNQDGVYQWHTFYGSGEADYGSDVAVDAQDNLIVSGDSFAGWLGDDSSPPFHAYSGMLEITLLKLDADGHYLWHTFYGSNDYDAAHGLALDANENIIISGNGNASWLGDGDTAPLHPFTDGKDLTVLKLAGGRYYLPLLQR